MYIKNIYLENFRNYEKQKIEFGKGINIIFGDNAQGKTNILEAIFLCSLGKSFRTNKEKEMININKDKTNIEIHIEDSDREKKIKSIIDEKKHFFINDIKTKKTSELLGNIYIVLFTPEDIGILKNEPSRRRRFLNIMISQLKPKYVFLLNKYNKILEQRNIYLKQIKYEKKNPDYLEIWDNQLYEINKEIYEYRKEFLNKINLKIKEIHYKITNQKENIEIKYKTNFKENFSKYLKENQKNDIEKGYTSLGIHRDDFEIYINNKLVSVYGSQGQIRTSIISLKIAEAEVIYEEVGERPILLLDDFMSELDKKRVNGLFDNINENQVLITCTDRIDLNNYNYILYNVNNAKVEKIN